MGHDGMLYSLPSRDLIADCTKTMVNAHRADAPCSISNCTRSPPAAMRLEHLRSVPGGPMELAAVEGAVEHLTPHRRHGHGC